MRTRAVYLFAAVILLVLGAAWNGGFIENTGWLTRKVTGQGTARSEPSSSVSISNSSSSALVTHSDSFANNSSLEAVMSAVNEQARKSTNPTALRKNDASASSTPSDSDGSTTADLEVVGVPFPVSESVEQRCEKFAAEHGESTSCKNIHTLLTKMSQEPRDVAWATTLEATLRRLIAADPKQFTIRAIECRTSLCAVEVASSNQFLGFSYSTQISNGIWAVDVWWGDETNPEGAPIVVTLKIFRRD